MSKKKAHILLIFFDILSLICLWAGYNLINQVVIDIAHSVDAVEFNNRVGFFCFGAMMPLVHLFAVYEYFWPKVVEKKMALFNWSALFLLIVLFACAFIISACVKSYVEQAGYLRCPEADHRLTFSSGLVYNSCLGRLVCKEYEGPVFIDFFS